jgi:transcription termination factor NusB
MSYNRAQERSLALQITFEAYVNSYDSATLEARAFESDEFEIENAEFALEISKGVIDKKEKLTNIINKFMTSRKLNRQNKVVQVCLLLGTYEIMTDTAPKNVIINE